MAEIVLGMGSSHGPMLTTPPEQWHLRAEDDRKNPAHHFRNRTWTYDTLLAERAGEGLEAQRLHRWQRQLRSRRHDGSIAGDASERDRRPSCPGRR